MPSESRAKVYTPASHRDGKDGHRSVEHIHGNGEILSFLQGIPSPVDADDRADGEVDLNQGRSVKRIHHHCIIAKCIGKPDDVRLFL